MLDFMYFKKEISSTQHPGTASVHPRWWENAWFLRGTDPSKVDDTMSSSATQKASLR